MFIFADFFGKATVSNAVHYIDATLHYITLHYITLESYQECLFVAGIVLPHWNAISQALDMAPHLVTFYSWQ